MKPTAKRQAREVALQALYAWQLSQADALEQMNAIEGFADADRQLAESIVRGVRYQAAEVRTLISPPLDRACERLSPVERAILYIGSFELSAHPATPFKV